MINIRAVEVEPMERPRAIHVVYAKWCPHCVPTTVEPLERRAEELGIPCFLHDIDTDEVKLADDLVEKYGDWSSDYVIPQVFLEQSDGKFEHVLTGSSRGVTFTKSLVENLLASGALAKSRP